MDNSPTTEAVTFEDLLDSFEGISRHSMIHGKEPGSANDKTYQSCRKAVLDYVWCLHAAAKEAAIGSPSCDAGPPPADVERPGSNPPPPSGQKPAPPPNPPSPEPRDKWQPIETAPKDGRWIVGSHDGASQSAVIKWSCGEWVDVEHGIRNPSVWTQIPKPLTKEEKHG